MSTFVAAGLVMIALLTFLSAESWSLAHGPSATLPFESRGTQVPAMEAGIPEERSYR